MTFLNLQLNEFLGQISTVKLQSNFELNLRIQSMSVFFDFNMAHPNQMYTESRKRNFTSSIVTL
jgi:hypothetical protein